MDTNIITFLACICFIFLFGKIFIVPIQKIIKIIINSILGGIVIYIINLIGANFGFHIGLNVITSIIVGTLGLPGAIILILIKLSLLFQMFLYFLLICFKLWHLQLQLL